MENITIKRYNGGTTGRRKEALELPPVQVHSTRIGEAQSNNMSMASGLARKSVQQF